MSVAEIERTLAQRALTRAAVEEFVYAEAALLDAWNIDAWLELFHPECQYEVTPTGQDDPASLSSNTSLFLIGDDHERLSQRVIRMNKKTAHVEYPRSKTRHLYSNVRVLKDDGKTVTASVNFVTFRTKNRVTTHYPGSFEIILERTAESFLIKRKRISLDLEALIPQGKVSIFL
jgi:p-cumate 2,3-dioxygenase beta subunit